MRVTFNFFRYGFEKWLVFERWILSESQFGFVWYNYEKWSQFNQFISWELKKLCKQFDNSKVGHARMKSCINNIKASSVFSNSNLSKGKKNCLSSFRVPVVPMWSLARSYEDQSLYLLQGQIFRKWEEIWKNWIKQHILLWLLAK